MGSRWLLIAVLAAAGCASKPAAEDCHASIAYLESLGSRMSVGGIMADELKLAIAEARALEADEEFAACRKVAYRARSNIEGFSGRR